MITPKKGGGGGNVTSNVVAQKKNCKKRGNVTTQGREKEKNAT